MVTLAEIGRGYGLGVSSHQKATPWFEGRAFMGEGREKSQRPPIQPPWSRHTGSCCWGGCCTSLRERGSEQREGPSTWIEAIDAPGTNGVGHG